MKKMHGFTLAETMITVAVIIILATIAAPSFMKTIEQTKSRKMSDFVVQLINYAKSESLNKNKNVYMTIANGVVCLSSKQKNDPGHICDLRDDPIQTGTTITINDADSDNEIIFDGVFGIPDTITTITIQTPSATKNVSVNILGLITVS